MAAHHEILFRDRAGVGVWEEDLHKEISEHEIGQSKTPHFPSPCDTVSQNVPVFFNRDTENYYTQPKLFDTRGYHQIPDLDELRKKIWSGRKRKSKSAVGENGKAYQMRLDSSLLNIDEVVSIKTDKLGSGVFAQNGARDLAPTKLKGRRPSLDIRAFIENPEQEVPEGVKRYRKRSTLEFDLRVLELLQQGCRNPSVDLGVSYESISHAKKRLRQNNLIPSVEDERARGEAIRERIKTLYESGCSDREIAEAVEISTYAAGQRLSRMRKKGEIGKRVQILNSHVELSEGVEVRIRKNRRKYLGRRDAIGQLQSDKATEDKSRQVHDFISENYQNILNYLYVTLRRRGVMQRDLEDAIQMGLEEILKHSERVNLAGNVYSYIANAAYFRWMDNIRKVYGTEGHWKESISTIEELTSEVSSSGESDFGHDNYVSFLSEYFDSINESSVVERDILVQEVKARVRDALSHIPEEQAGVLVEREAEDISLREYSERYNIPLGTVKTRERLGKQKLRSELEAFMNGFES